VKNLSVETRWEADEAVLALTGELDLSTAGQVERELEAAEERGPSKLVIDLRGVSFLDSTGLRVVLSADGRARRDGRRLEVIPGPPPVHRVFRIALLDRRIVFVDPPDDDGSEDAPRETSSSDPPGGGVAGSDEGEP
jgi:anti-sigma B factor antagonist